MSNPLGFQAPYLEAGQNVQERFDPSAALSVMENLWHKGQKRRKLWASIDMEMDCAPPYDEQELAEKGRGFQSNFSSRILEGDVNLAVSRYISLLNSQENQAILPIKIDAELPEGWGAQDMQVVLQSIYNEAVKLWHEKRHTDSCAIYDMTKYGQCLYMNMGMLDWRDRRVPPAHILLPDNASSLEENWDMIGIIDHLRLDHLVEIVENSEDALKQGWNPAGVMHMLLQNHIPNWRENIFSWDDALNAVRAMRTNSIGTSDNDIASFTIPVVRVYVREYERSSPEVYNYETGKYDTTKSKEKNQISLYIVPQFKTTNDGIFQDKNDCATIYRKRFAFNDFDDIFTVGQFMPHEYFWGARGLGQMTLNFAVADSILQSGAMDAAMAALEMRFIPQSNDDLETLENVRDSNILPPGTNILETSNYAKNISVALSVSQNLQQRKVLNLAQQAIRAPGAISPYETATGAQLRVAQETSNLSQQELRFWLDQDRRVRRQVKNLIRLLDMTNNNHYLSEEINCKPIIEHIKKRLENFGLPQDAFSYVNIALVTSGKTFGKGTLQEQMISFSVLEKYLPALAPEAQDYALRGMLTLLYGPDDALRMVPPRKSLTRNEDQQMWEANQENAAIEAGFMPYLRRDDMDIIHINQHLNLVENLKAQLDSPASDPVRLLNALITAQAHIFGQGGHVERYLLRINRETNNGRETMALLAKAADNLQQIIAATEAVAQQRLEAGQMTELEKARLAELQTRVQRNLVSIQNNLASQANKNIAEQLRNEYIQTQTAYMQNKMMQEAM